MLHKANVIPESNLPLDAKGPQPPVIRPEFVSSTQHVTGNLTAVNLNDTFMLQNI